MTTLLSILIVATVVEIAFLYKIVMINTKINIDHEIIRYNISEIEKSIRKIDVLSK